MDFIEINIFEFSTGTKKHLSEAYHKLILLIKRYGIEISEKTF